MTASIDYAAVYSIIREVVPSSRTDDFCLLLTQYLTGRGEPRNATEQTAYAAVTAAKLLPWIKEANNE